MTRLVVVGQGYVGLPMALRAAEVGIDVVGLDTSTTVVADLNSGRSHIDDVSDEALAAGLAGRYRASDDPSCIAEADAVIVCVPTPLAADGGPDLGPVERAARTVGEHVRAGTLVVLESTTYPGTTEEVFAPLVTASGLTVGTDVHIAFSPERVDPGNPTYGVRNTPKVVGGLTPACTEAARELYEQFIDTVIEAKGAREAEMAKLIENTFRHVNIALMNEMVRFCHELDIDLWNAIDCAATKPFGFMPFRPGPGVGGHCIPIDPSYLSHRVKAQLGYAFRMVELAEEINHAAPEYVARRIWEALNDRGIPVKGSRVLVLGVTYKENIGDRRESPADPLARRLASWGAQLAYADPYVSNWSPGRADDDEVPRVQDVYRVASEFDIAVLLQNHRDFDLESLVGIGVPILDTRGVVPPGPTVERL